MFEYQIEYYSKYKLDKDCLQTSINIVAKDLKAAKTQIEEIIYSNRKIKSYNLVKIHTLQPIKIEVPEYFTV